jgi:ribosomal protein S6
MPELLRPYEVMIILDADLDEETIREAVERWLTLIESNGAERGSG